MATKLIAAAAIAPTSLLAKVAGTTRPPVDVAVIGAGVFGAWTAHALHSAGQSIALLDAFGPGNSRSSSGGETRITRSAYGDREIYARWAAESLTAWKALARRTGLALFEETGVLTIIPGGDRFADDSSTVLQRLGIRYQRLSAGETMRRFPQFTLKPTESAIFEPDAGALMARRAVQALVSELVAGGVDYRMGAVLPPSGSGKLRAIETEAGGTITAARYVFACGPWLPKVFPGLLKARIRAQRAEVFFLGVPAGDTRYFPPAMPAWIDRGGMGDAYGFPSLDGRGCKLAVDALDNPIDPDTGDRTVTAPYIAAMRSFVRQRIPGLGEAPIVETRVCQYEYAENKNYLLDRHPDFTNVWIAGGGSGHGFKNGPMVGDYVARQLLDQAPADPRFSITRTGNE
jgi:glycine/D-amino acid oxidase-like deaminating enzyme